MCDASQSGRILHFRVWELFLFIFQVTVYGTISYHEIVFVIHLRADTVTMI